MRRRGCSGSWLAGRRGCSDGWLKRRRGRVRGVVFASNSIGRINKIPPSVVCRSIVRWCGLTGCVVVACFAVTSMSLRVLGMCVGGLVPLPPTIGT